MPLFPENPGALTVAWLNTILHEAGVLSNVTLTSLQTEAPGRGGVLGEVVCCRLTYDTDTTAAPRSLIAKFAPPNPKIRAMLLESNMSKAEVQFYQQCADLSGVRTPQCYYAALDPAIGSFVLLLENLSPAQPGSWLVGCTTEQAHQIVRAIAGLHAAWWNSPRLTALAWLPTWTPIATQEMVQPAWQPFLARVGASVPAALVEIGERLAMHILEVENQLMSPPLTLIHNDFHLDNLFLDTLDSTRSVAVIDWQFLTIDKSLKDIAFFLGGNMDPDQRKAHEGEILHTYHTALQDGGVANYSFEQCVHDYQLALLDSWARFIFSIGMHLEPDERLPFLCGTVLPRFYAAILDTQAGELLPARTYIGNQFGMN